MTDDKPVQPVSREEKPKKIMTQPLPQILDDIENSIRLANEAAKNAREAAEEARKAGEKAAREAERVASEAIARVEKVANEAMQLAELLKAAITDATAAINNRLSGKTK
jgi:flagellar biosynthesis/type III secretory pathway protein FliH